MAVKDYQDLIVWQKAMELAEKVHVISRTFPTDERYGLTSQLRRASVSVASNIAEGQGRFTDADFVRFLSIANGSLRETGTQLLLAKRFQYLEESKYQEAYELA